ncbi:hypothetical protein BH11PSE4_BH11PSE4_09350 [soil metagenome]
MRVISTLLVLMGSTLPALAGDGFHIVVPGRPGVPIIINGVDASYAVVEGDWGLARGIHVQPTVYGGRYVDPEPNVGHYYPSAGRTPGYGRLEIEPPKNRKLPKPAASHHESWSAQSAPPAPQEQVPFYPPPVIEVPRDGGGLLPQNPGPSIRNNRN